MVTFKDKRMNSQTQRCSAGITVSKGSMRVGDVIESFLNREAESKLGVSGGTGANLGNANKSFRCEAEKSVYKACMGLRVAQRRTEILVKLCNSIKVIHDTF